MADVMNNSSHVDPDAQATVTDFIDYTEHLPSDIRRSLALIDKLDDLVRTSHNKIHLLSQQWSKRVEASEGVSAEKAASDLRGQISYQKELSRKYAWASLAEARRLDQEIGRHQNLLKITSLKLDALPLPPSRDPSPRPLSPQAVRAADSGGPKIKLRLDKARIAPNGAPRPRGRRMVIVPGEVLPPPNPNSPTPSFSDWDSPSPPQSPHRAGRKLPKAPKSMRPDGGDGQYKKKKERQPRDPNKPGTNVHSSVAGISTSNALLMLTPPPVNPIPGSKHAPWTRLTEWEMARLRKRMKKNAVWTPSDTMIRRELHDAGRGPENYLKAKQRAEELGEELIDCDNLASRAPGEEVKPGEIPLGSKSRLTNKGMSLNVQKKHKKLLLAREMALELARESARDKSDQLTRPLKGRGADETDRAKEAARLRAENVESQLSLLGPQFRDLFTRPGEEPLEKDRIVLKTTGRKRRRDLARVDESHLHPQLHSEIVVTPSPGSTSKKLAKRQKVDATSPESSPLYAGTTTTKVPLAAAAPSPGKATSNTASSGIRRLSLVIKPPAPPSRRSSRTSTPATDRPGSRHSLGRQSSEPPRDRTRRKSATPGTPAVVTLASSRRKRPAPGPVTNLQGGTPYTVGKRDKKPSKKGSRKGAKGEAADEDDVDPNEARYCVCNDVSWGTMVMCESPDCENQWFHLECVGLTEIPARRVKWWCPDCSRRLGKARS